jgi:CheY-like chemotaxis protein
MDLSSTKRDALSILLVDDDKAVRNVLFWQLLGDGHIADCAADGAQALEKIAATRYDVVITDQSMPCMNGDKLAKIIRQRVPETALVLLTGFGQTYFNEGSYPAVNVVLGKPFTGDELQDAIAQARRSVLAAEAIA